MLKTNKAQQVFVIMICWAALLILIDRNYNKHFKMVMAANPGKQEVTIVLNHYCCNGCTDTTQKALMATGWLENLRNLNGAISTQAQATASAGKVEDSSDIYKGGVVGDIRADQVGNIDFAKIDRAVRDSGLVPQQITVTGVHEFQLTAHLPHMCCGACVAAAKDTFKADKTRTLPISLVGTPTVEQPSQQITAIFHDTADVAQFMRMIEDTGFEPDSVHMTVLR